eukprot:1633814-Pleurochrysis_carterae.AAC.4
MHSPELAHDSISDSHSAKPAYGAVVQQRSLRPWALCKSQKAHDYRSLPIDISSPGQTIY